MHRFRSRFFRAGAAVAVGSLASLGLSGLAFATPLTTPTLTAPTDGATVAGVVPLTATSTAADVQFLVDGVDLGVPVAVTSGSASTTWPTDGLLNGTHTIAAADCDTDCATPSATISVTVANVAPTLTAPTSAETVGSATTLTADSTAGGVEFFVDGVAAGFDGTSPFSMPVSGLAAGAHTAAAQACNAAGTACAGPTSAPTSFTVQVLHPSITALAPTGVSPNGDGLDDTATVTFSIPDTEAVSYTIVPSGSEAIVRGPVSFGFVPAGTHSFVWNGLDNSGHRPADGLYTIKLHTYQHLTGSELATGDAARDVRIDDTAPSLASLTGPGATFYPYPDTYGDTWSAHITVGESAHVNLDIVNSHHAVLRRVTVSHSGPGTVALTWNGRLTNGSLAPAGTYSFRIWAEDMSGNRHFTAYYVVHDSAKRLVSKSATVQVNGDSGSFFATNTSSCNTRGKASDFPNGEVLTIGCTNSYGYGQYSIAVPGATRYSTIDLKTYGNTFYAPDHIYGAWLNYGPNTLSLGSGKALSHNATNAWIDLGTVSASGRVSGGHVQVAVVVPNVGTKVDFDIGYVAVTIHYQVLQ